MNSPGGQGPKTRVDSCGADALVLQHRKRSAESGLPELNKCVGGLGHFRELRLYAPEELNGPLLLAPVLEE